jgi:acyl carrier protein
MTSPKEPSPAVAATTQEIIDLIKAEAGGAVEVSTDSTLQSTGLDSLKLMSLIFKIEDRYDIKFLDEEGDDIETVGDLANLVVRQVQEQRA